MTDPRIHARRVRVERQRGRRRLGVMLAVLVAAAASAGVVALLHSSLFGARTVVISGADHTSRGQVLEVTGLNREPPLIDVNTTVMARRLDRLPWVGEAWVHVDWPSTVSVAVVERTPIAVSILATGGYALLDVTGRVLADQAKRPRGLPVVSVRATPGRPGSSLGIGARPVLAAAAALPVSLLSRVDEIVGSGLNGVVLRMKGGLKAVVGDDDALQEKFVSLATVLQRVNLDRVATIDLRVPAIPVLTPLASPSNVQGKGDG